MSDEISTLTESFTRWRKRREEEEEEDDGGDDDDVFDLDEVNRAINEGESINGKNNKEIYF